MGFEQYHEPAAELSKEVRTFARMLTSLTEEAEAIGWYEQRISLETDRTAKKIMQKAQEEEIDQNPGDTGLSSRSASNVVESSESA